MGSRERKCSSSKLASRNPAQKRSASVLRSHALAVDVELDGAVERCLESRHIVRRRPSSDEPVSLDNVGEGAARKRRAREQGDGEVEELLVSEEGDLGCHVVLVERAPLHHMENQGVQGGPLEVVQAPRRSCA